MKFKIICLSGILFFQMLRVAFAKEPDLIHRQINWLPPFDISADAGQKLMVLNFEKAAFNENQVAYYLENIPLAGNVSSVRVEIENAQFEPFKEEDLLTNKISPALEITVQSKISYHKKLPYAAVTFLPYRKNAFTGHAERLVAFDLKISPLSYASPATASRFYTSGSVLAHGDWYKMSVSQDGVYKLSYQFLKNLGIDVDNIDPRNLKVYGNGGGMLPFANSTPRYDDLQQNAIYVSGENDGHFDHNDYVLFYGQSPTRWTYNTGDKKFHHDVNLYSDSTFYFITADGGSATVKRIQMQNSSSSTPTHFVTSFDDYGYHEADLYNLIKSGREWYGEQFDGFNSTKNFDFSFPNLVSTERVKIKVDAVGRATSASCAFQLSANGQNLSTLTLASLANVQYFADYARETAVADSFLTSVPLVSASLHFSSADASAIGWLNYIEMNARRELNYSGAGNQFGFRDSRTTGAGKVAQFTISNVNTALQVWDVTDPINVAEQQVITGGTDLSFTIHSDILHQFVAFNSSSFLTAKAVGKVANQNLHALPQSQLFIVTHPDFLAASNELADFHRAHDHLSVSVVTTTQVYNEFSSGAPDVSAIRDFMKMFYERGLTTDMPKYLLLMGDASYDNKNRLPSNTNFVLSYQSQNSLVFINSYISDDFFGLLDDSEGQWNETDIDMVDISVGRLPVKTPAEAASMLKKIKTYASPDPSSVNVTQCQQQAGSVFGDWRNIVTFVGDDQDGNIHIGNADELANIVRQNYPVYNIDKIYLDAYKQESSPGGQRYPDARKAISDRVQRGTLLMTYVGHGGEVGWAHERVLEVEDINGWTNSNSLAAFLTATCEFTRVDDPGRTSAGEYVLLNPNGGGICLFTTSRLALSGQNQSLSKYFFAHFFSPMNGKMPTIGDVFEQTKIDYNVLNTRNFLLLGDPALTLAYPEWDVKTTAINSVAVNAVADTLKALSKVTISGTVQNKSGQKLAGFNGIIYPTVYDKAVTYKTLGQDSLDSDPDSPFPFVLQKNVLYRGKANVTNGDFSFTFVIPKDISLRYGFGRLSYYATNGVNDANGYYENLIIGGVNAAAGLDDKGPDVKLYLNDDKFAFGGLTDQNPYLYAIISDTSGVNTVGTGIGHDITTQLDHDNNKLFVLNDYYQADLNNYQKGSVKYKLSSLSEGRHSVKFKVWDVYNNSSEAYTEFIVSGSASLALEHVLNYPNPFTTHTNFMFEYNCPCTSLEVMIQIFTVSGKLIKTIDQRVHTEGYRSDQIEWNGLDDYGNKIGRGVYVYKLRVKASDTKYAEKFEKLVILK